jgi:hypothetical protein
VGAIREQIGCRARLRVDHDDVHFVRRDVGGVSVAVIVDADPIFEARYDQRRPAPVGRDVGDGGVGDGSMSSTVNTPPEAATDKRSKAGNRMNSTLSKGARVLQLQASRFTLDEEGTPV